MSNCATCRVLLNTSDPLTKDCGGDCLLCMAEAGDPDCALVVVEQIRPLQRRFEEHLAAWKANNEWHAKRVAELEAAIKAMASGDNWEGRNREVWEELIR